MYYAVIGNNYGDEGKGLAVDYLTCQGNNLVVRHNGGAQAAHTVEKDGMRFVFHELSSGSFNGAATYWAPTFYPDLYKLEEEIESFRKVSGRSVKIYASPKASVTLLYDVYLNQKKEKARGTGKHGSCGMGIWEATRRSSIGFALTLEDISHLSAEEIARRLSAVENDYMRSRLEENSIGEPLILDKEKYASLLKQALEDHVTLVSGEKALFEGFNNVIFEGGQGLLLDNTREESWPHTTCSRTGITNPVKILEGNGSKLDETVYVTRTYLTRHGAGPFRDDPALFFEDETNVPNPWQDSIRFGRHESAGMLFARASGDVKDNCPYDVKVSVFITHLNETSGKILTEEGGIGMDSAMDAARKEGIGRLYLSDSRFSKDVKIRDISS